MSNRTTGRPPAHAKRAARARPPPEPTVPEPAPVRDQALPPHEASVTILVRPGDPPEHLFRHLLSAYLGGASTFEVVERPRLTPTARQVVREFCRRTRQPEVVVEERSALVIADRDKGSRETVEERLAQLGSVVLAFHREAVDSWERLPLGDDGAWASRDDDVDREAWYLERSIVRGAAGSGARPQAATAAWTIARSLERIGDHAVTLGEVGPRLVETRDSAALLRELRQFHAQALRHLEDVLLQPDGSRANDLLDVGEALAAEGRTLSERLLPAVGDGSTTPASAAAVARALEAIGRTVAYTQDIAQAWFDRAVAPTPRQLPSLSEGRVVAAA